MKLYLLSREDLLLLNYSLHQLINMTPNLLTSALIPLPLLTCHHPFVPPPPYYQRSLTFFLCELKKGGGGYMKSQTAWSIQIAPCSQKSVAEDCTLKVLWEAGWRSGWKSGAEVVQTPPSSFHPSIESFTPPKPLQVYFGAWALSLFRNIFVAHEQASHPPHSMALVQVGVCSLISPIHTLFKAWALWLIGWQVKFKG